MSSTFRVFTARSLAVVAASLALCPMTFAAKKGDQQEREAVEQRLSGKYKLSTFTPGRGPITVGSILLVQKPGLDMIAAGGRVEHDPGSDAFL